MGSSFCHRRIIIIMDVQSIYICRKHVIRFSTMLCECLETFVHCIWTWYLTLESSEKDDGFRPQNTCACLCITSYTREFHFVIIFNIYTFLHRYPHAHAHAHAQFDFLRYTAMETDFNVQKPQDLRTWTKTVSAGRIYGNTVNNCTQPIQCINTMMIIESHAQENMPYCLCDGLNIFKWSLISIHLTSRSNEDRCSTSNILYYTQFDWHNSNCYTGKESIEWM